MSGLFKFFIVTFGLFIGLIGFKTGISAVESSRVSELAEKIKTGKLCESAPNRMECAHDEFLRTASFTASPMIGQELLTEVFKVEMGKSPEKGRFIKDQYYIQVSELYTRSLQKRKASLLGFVPQLLGTSLEVRAAVSFYKGMSDYSNERELNRTIASETILQETSNFNASMDQLASLIREFH